MAMPQLNDDIFQTLMPSVDRRTLLSVALVSKRLNAISTPYILSAVHCGAEGKLTQAYKTISIDMPNRARALRVLTIHVRPEGPTASPTATLIADLLSQTPNLTTLSMHFLHGWLACDPRLEPAICALPALAHLDLTCFAAAALALIRALPRSLRTLALDCYGDVEDQRHDWDTLLTAIARHADLHHLSLARCTLSGTSRAVTHARSLSLDHVRFPECALAHAFPRASALRWGMNVCANAPWPRLARVEITRRQVTQLRAAGVHWLDVRQAGVHNAASYTACIDALSPPVGLCTVVDAASGTAVWDAVGRAVPGLQALELEVVDSRGVVGDWLAVVLMSAAFTSLPVRYLRLLVPASRGMAKEDLENFDSQVLGVVPGILANAMPRLRYVALEQYDPEDSDERERRLMGPFWRVVEGEGGRELREIPDWEWTRVREFMRDPKNDWTKDFDDQFVPLR